MMTSKTLIRMIRFRRKEKGQSIVEFALLAPILMILFMGMFDFGWILHQQIQMDNAARHGARRGAIGETNAAIIARMRTIMSFDQTGVVITIDVLNAQGVSIGAPNDRTPNNIIRVSVDKQNVQLITPLAGLIQHITTINLRSRAEFLIE